VSNGKHYRKTTMKTMELHFIKPSSSFFLNYTDTISSSSDRESSHHRITHRATLAHGRVFMFEFLFKSLSAVLYWMSERKYFSVVKQDLCLLES